MQLTPEQLAAVDGFTNAWSDSGRAQYVIAGLAGTGKSTLIPALVEEVRAARYNSVAVCTPTGKAAHVLRVKGVDDAITLHALLYYPRQARGQDKVVFVDNDEDMPDVVIVDEASMLDKRIVRDLRARVPFVCFVGDHGQLEPVGEDSGLMQRPDFRLETIHRQVAGSPIIRFAYRVREGKAPMTTDPQLSRVVTRAGQLPLDYDVILCAYNKTRVKLNAWVRRRKGFTGRWPQVGEQVICLRNSREWRVFNGMTGVVAGVNERRRLLSVETDDGRRNAIPFEPRQFGEAETLQDKALLRKGAPTLWDWAYAITVHKFQGSEAATVAVYDEAPTTDLWSVHRWRYTAATRASERLLWIVK